MLDKITLQDGTKREITTTNNIISIVDNKDNPSTIVFNVDTGMYEVKK